MTKAKRIRKLYAAGKTTREIADIVGCRIEYVRIVARQRKGRGGSESDKRYKASKKGEVMRRNRQPCVAAYGRLLAQYLRYGHSAEFARHMAREAYAAAKQKTPPSAELGGA